MTARRRTIFLLRRIAGHREAQYAKGESLLAAGDYDGATAAYQAAGDYSDAPTKAQDAQYKKGREPVGRRRL